MEKNDHLDQQLEDSEKGKRHMNSMNSSLQSECDMLNEELRRKCLLINELEG